MKTLNEHKTYRKLTAAEKKYGVNEWPELLLCPRCICANPVGITYLSDETGQLYRQFCCKKCAFYGHKDGSIIKMEKYTPESIEWAKEVLNWNPDDIDRSKMDYTDIIDG